MTLTQKDPMVFFCSFFYKLTPQLISLTSLHMIEFHFCIGRYLGGVFISGIINPIIKSVKFSFWVSVVSITLLYHLCLTYELIILYILWFEKLFGNDGEKDTSSVVSRKYNIHKFLGKDSKTKRNYNHRL